MLRNVVVGTVFAVLAYAHVLPPASAVPPPAEQSSADCDHPVYAVDMLVCKDAKLLTSDAELRRLVAVFNPAMLLGVPPFLEAQADWFRRRSLCAFQKDARACTVAAYQERLIVLRALSARVGPMTFECFTKDMPVIGALRLASGDLALFSNGDFKGVAIAIQPKTFWSPFVRLEGRPKRPIVRSASLGSLHCKLKN